MLVCGCLLLLLIVNALNSIYNMSSIGMELEAIAEQDIPITESITSVTEHYLVQLVHFERAVRLGEKLSTRGPGLSEFEKQITMFTGEGERILNELTDLEAFLDAQIKLAHSALEKDEFSSLVDETRDVRHKYSEFYSGALEMVRSLQSRGTQLDDAVLHDLELSGDALREHLGEMLHEIELFTHAAADRAESHEQSALRMMVYIIVASVVIGILLSWVVSKSIVNRLSLIARSALYIAEGDLTQEVLIDGDDEVGALQASMKRMQDSLKGIIFDMAQLSDEIASSSEELSTTVVQTSENINSQHEETAVVATAMNQMSATVQEVASNASETSRSVKDVSEQTSTGIESIGGVISDIQTLAGEMENNSVVIAQVSDASNNIYAVIDVIKSIAEQTNLLALNAAIEAARAGDQGRGFAVVADEVRTLAGRTQESTLEINKMIEQLQNGSRNTVDVMNRSLEKAKSVANEALGAGESLSTISNSIGNIDVMTQQIASAAEEQSVVAESMSVNITRISEISDENMLATKSIAEASSNLAEVSANLQGIISRFKIA